MATKSQNQVATKEDIREFRDDVKNYMGVLHEKFSDEVKVVAEQYTGVDKRLIRMESKTDILVDTAGEIKIEMTKIKEDVSVLKTDVSVLKTDVSELKTDMKEVKEELLPKATKKVDGLEHRVAVLESRA